MPLNFLYKKSTQALNFFAIQRGGEISKLEALKFVFFADRYHLRKYGRPITFDRYLAMPMGPVASGTKDIAELDCNEYLGSEKRRYASRFLSLSKRPHYLKSVREVDEKELSETDLEALQFAWDKFRNVRRLPDFTHQYPEWKKHEAALKGTTWIEMSYADFLEDPPSRIEPCFSLTSEDRKDRLEQLEELKIIHSIWS